MSKPTRRILHIINGIGTGGAEESLLRLLSASRKDGFENIVLSLEAITKSDRRELFEEAGACVISLRAPLEVGTLFFHVPLLLLRLRRFVRALSPDLIHGWMYHGALVSCFAQMFALRGTPVVWAIRRSLYRAQDLRSSTRFILRILRLFSKCPSQIIFNSTVSQTQHENFGLCSDSVVISNGVPLGDFSPSQDKRENRLREHSLPSHSLLIGHVGRFVPEKDHKAALCAFALLRAKNPGLHFVMIGRGVSSTNGAFVDLCRTVGFDPFSVESPLLLLDERGDLSQILPALDVLLSSSCTEGFPNVVAEAMSCGVPCVVTDVGESAYIVGDTGAVVPPSDPEACAAALTQLVEASPKSRKERGESARLRIKENFSVESFTSKTLSLYEEVLNLDEKATPSTVDT